MQKERNIITSELGVTIKDVHNIEDLRDVLVETLNMVRLKKIDNVTAKTIIAAAMAIMYTVKLELMNSSLVNNKPEVEFLEQRKKANK